MPSLGEMGGGMPSLGTGASGFGQQLADLIGGLVGSGASEATGEETSEGALPDPQDLDPADDIDEPDEEAEDESSDAADETANEDDPEASDEEPAPPEEPEPAPPEPAVTPVPPPPEPPVPPAVQEAMPVEKTPCEIAADELPQVGE
jgi:hypothetical protein